MRGTIAHAQRTLTSRPYQSGGIKSCVSGYAKIDGGERGEMCRSGKTAAQVFVKVSMRTSVVAYWRWKYETVSPKNWPPVLQS